MLSPKHLEIQTGEYYWEPQEIYNIIISILQIYKQAAGQVLSVTFHFSITYYEFTVLCVEISM